MESRRSWSRKEDVRIMLALARGRSPWQVAKTLHQDLGRTKRAIDTRARKLYREAC